MNRASILDLAAAYRTARTESTNVARVTSLNLSID